MIEIVIPEFTNPFEVTWWLFTHGGFIAVIIAVLYGIFWMYMEYIQTKFAMNTKYILLAVDVPKENEQTPKAVEHIFSHIHGVWKDPNWKEKYLAGYIQATVTIELISLGGYIQYLIRCPASNRDLIEGAIYAQYPTAEISEVEDYVNQFKPVFSNPDYDMWGAELILVNKDPYPIKTYPLWEHSLTQTFLDPMASLLEIMGRLRQGEQMWLQFILKPTMNEGWRKKGVEIINKLSGIKNKKKSSGLASLAEAPGQLAIGTWETVTRTLFDPSTTSKKTTKEEPYSLMMHLPPHIKNVIEAIGIKISKLGFETKSRFIYIASKDQFDKSRVQSFFGAMKQFQALDLNGFKPDKKMKTQRVWFFVDQRVNNLKRRILLGYKYRSNWWGRRMFLLNTEELASVWHFPVITVKAPQVKKSEAKRGEPPVELPIGDEVEYVPKPKKNEPETVTEDNEPATDKQPTEHTGTPPDNLPVV